MKNDTTSPPKEDKHEVAKAIVAFAFLAAFLIGADSFFSGIRTDKIAYLTEGQFAISQRNPDWWKGHIAPMPGKVTPSDIDIWNHLQTDRLFVRSQDYKVRATLDRLSKKAINEGFQVEDATSGKVRKEKTARVDYAYNAEEAQYEVYVWGWLKDDSPRSRGLAITIGDGLGLDRRTGKRTLRISRYEKSSFFLNPETSAMWQKLAHAIGAEEIDVSIIR